MSVLSCSSFWISQSVMTSFGRCSFPTDLWEVADGERRHDLIISFRERQKERNCLILHQPPGDRSGSVSCAAMWLYKQSNTLDRMTNSKKEGVEGRSKWSCLKYTVLRWWRRKKTPTSPTVLWILVLCTANKSQYWLFVACWWILTCAEILFSVKSQNERIYCRHSV